MCYVCTGQSISQISYHLARVIVKLFHNIVVYEGKQVEIDCCNAPHCIVTDLKSPQTSCNCRGFNFKHYCLVITLALILPRGEKNFLEFFLTFTFYWNL